MKQIRNYAFLFLVAGVLIGLDQWTKSLVRANLPLGGTWLPDSLYWLAPYARIVHWYNTGAAFGMFQDFWWVFATLAFLVAGLIIYYYPQVHDEDWWLKLAMGMQLAGALGNVIDRMQFEGKVTDFISVGSFPVFNVADSSITIGVVILLLGVWYKEILIGKQTLAQPEAGAEQTSDPSDEAPGE